MKITFLGSSHGLPEANRKCSCILIEIGENRYVIDMGTDITEQFATKNLPLESIKAIFITHMHGDHANGLVSFTHLCSWAYTEVDPAIFIPGDLAAVKSAIDAWLKCNLRAPRLDFDYRPVQIGALYDDGIAKITAFETKHIANSYAYLFEAEGKRILFSGDLSHNGPADDFPVCALSEPLDLAVCEVAHFPATDYLPLFKGKKNLKRLCFNHYSERFLSSALAAKAELSEIEVTVAQDGMEFTV